MFAAHRLDRRILILQPHSAYQDAPDTFTGL